MVAEVLGLFNAHTETEKEKRRERKGGKERKNTGYVTGLLVVTKHGAGGNRRKQEPFTQGRERERERERERKKETHTQRGCKKQEEEKKERPIKCCLPSSSPIRRKKHHTPEWTKSGPTLPLPHQNKLKN